MLLPTKVVLPSGSPPELVRAIRGALLAPVAEGDEEASRFKKGCSPFYFVKACDTEYEASLKLLANRL